MSRARRRHRGLRGFGAVAMIALAGGCSATGGSDAPRSPTPALTAPLASAAAGSAPTAAVTVAPTATASTTAAATSSATPDLSLSTVVRLKGPFGTVPGEPRSVGEPWPDPATLEPLDAYVQHASLTAGFADPDETFATWRIVAAPAADPGDASEQELGSGPSAGQDAEYARVRGPDAGEWLVRADSQATGESGPVAWYWRLTVPDRDLPADGELHVPLPQAVLTQARASATAQPGSSCYIDTCNDIGRPPPAASLPVLHVDAATDMTLWLSDGSHFGRWSVTAQPAADRMPHAAQLAAGRESPPVGSVSFRAPASGDWYAAISVTFDRERGHAQYYVRIVAR